MKEFIPVNTPVLSGNEAKYLKECIDTGWISSEGAFVKKFEERIAEITNRKYAIAVSNGTAAIDIAVEALNFKKGDEIILPTHTIISCINQIIRCGLKAVFVDSDADTWNMNVNDIENKITSKTKAIMVVHTYGLPVEMNKVLDLAKKYNLKIIEDSAEMIGQKYLNQPCGSFGDISTLSFYPNKHITTGEGGMCLTNDKFLAEKCRSLKNLCFSNPRFVHHNLGWNYRMTNMQAAIGLAQTERIDEIILRKRQIGDRYYSNLKSLKNDFDLPSNKSYAKNIFWVFGLCIKSNKKYNAKDIIEKLNLKGIGSRPFFYSLHKQPIFNKMNLFKDEYYPISELMSKNGFYLPSGLAITNDQIDYVSNSLIDIIDNL